QEEIERAKENRSPNYSFTTNYGKNFSMDSLNGNVVLLILWNLSNAPSKQAIENLKFLNENNKNKKFKILAIHSTRDTEAVKRYTQGTEKFEFDIVFADNDIGFLFPSPDNLPQNVILDKRGKIIYQKTGFDENELKNVIDSLLLE
ncbi:redoxin domain-containing protein, partial [Candidatus Poribacteria bacterium]|nr:redoxin domain-containing protein [Candidatus Poribacteria bacterium]